MEELLVALNSTLVQPTPQCSPVFSRKVKEAAGELTFSDGKKKKIYSTKFSNSDIKIILGTDNFNIIENYDNLIFKILDKTFTIPKSLYI